MSIKRKLPNSDEKREIALNAAKSKNDNTAPEYKVLSTNTQTRLDATQPLFAQKIQARATALSAQAIATTLKVTNQLKAKIYISHFIRSFNMGVDRGLFPASHRAFYNLDINSNSVPPLTAEASVTEWGDWLISGDIRRIAAGGAPMAMPTIAEVEEVYTNFINATAAQSTLKDAYDKAQEAVSNMRPEVDSLILRIWNEVETAFDDQLIESKRRHSRGWGVVYINTQRATITGRVTNSVNGNPLQGVSVTIIESGDIAQTLADGTYKLRTKFTGEGTLEFTLIGFVTQTFPIVVTEESSLTQDVHLQPM